MKSLKNINKSWLIAGGAILLALLVWWVWLVAYVPYDKSDPAVQEQLTMISNLRKDIEEQKAVVSSYIQIGHIYEELGDDRRALATYRKLARLRPKSSVPFTALGQYYSERERYDLARKNILKAVENDADNVSGYQDLIFLYTYNFSEEKDELEALILDAIAQNKSIENNLIHALAFFFRDIGDKEKAVFYLNKLIELVPESKSLWLESIAELEKN